MANLKLNFLPLSNQNFNFHVYRKERNQDELKADELYSCHLFNDDTKQSRKNYLVSFGKKEGYDEYLVSSKESIGLTKRYLTINFLETLYKTSQVYKIEYVRSFAEEKVEFIINETIKGKQIVYLAPYYFKQQEKFGFIIDYRFAKNPGQAFDREVQRLSLSLDASFHSNKDYYGDKFRFIGTFLSKTYSSIHVINTYDDLTFVISDTLCEVPCFQLNKKEYVFNNNNIAYSQFQGIRNFGPFKKLENEPLFMFIFNDKHRSFANDLFLSLVGKLNPGTFPGFDQMFKVPLSTENIVRVQINGAIHDELGKVMTELNKYKTNYPTKKIIGIFIEDYDIDNDNNEIGSQDYFFLKYNFIKNDVPLQVINYKRLSEKNSLKWSTSNIALGIFSKLGGIPWVVKPSNTNCLILGIGCSQKIDPITKTISKYFAYSVCLDSSGIYKQLSVLADEQEWSHYLEKLRENLIALLKSGKFSNYTSCVLHLPFKIKQGEIEAIASVVKEVSNMDFVAIKINLKNKFFAFSSHNTYVPYESSFIKLSKDEYLVWFEGLLYGKELVDKRLSNPVHIQFLNISEQKNFDQNKYLQDVLNLSGANWRGFNAKSIPISIYYSQIIAKYTKAFEQIEGYNELVLSNEKPWFL